MIIISDKKLRYLLARHAKEAMVFKQTGVIEYGSNLFTALYDYFVWETREMPYDVAKCRTGDPVDWIIDRLNKELELVA